MEDTARTERDKLITRVLGDTGMRVGELVRLPTDDLVVRPRKNFLQCAGRAISTDSYRSSTRRYGDDSNASYAVAQPV